MNELAASGSNPSEMVTECTAARRASHDQLFSQHLPALRRWVKGRVPNPADADDVIQETILLGLRHMQQFRFEASLSTWLCQIALNVIRGRRRCPEYSRLMITEPRTIEQWTLHDPRESPFAVLEACQIRKSLHRAIRELPADYREVVELRDLRGYSVRETALHLDLSSAAVKSRHYRARIQLRSIFLEEGLVG